MSTRSLIGIERENNMVEYVFCHWDGYPSYVGSILKNYYSTKDKIEKILLNGDVDVLKNNTQETTFYNRDLGYTNEDIIDFTEEDALKSKFINKDEYFSTRDILVSEYRYLLDLDGQLLCYDPYDDDFCPIP